MTWTVKELLDFFEGYYGEKYSGIVLDTTVEYLDGHTADFYKAVAEVMIKRFSRCYGKSPCPADIERHLDEILETIPKREYLPEPEQVLTDGERAEVLDMLGQVKRQLNEKQVSPMTKTLTNICDVYETKIRERGNQ